MNPFSVISTIIYTSFFIGAIVVFTAERKSILNISAAAVLISLGWWSFCNSFFFAAATQEQAWFWHRLSSIGWCSFVVFTVYYFFALTDYCKIKKTWWKKVLFFSPAIVLICRNLFGETTSLAQNIVMSVNGWGWTYENSVKSFWLWAYLIFVAVYFGFAFCLLYKWSKAVKHRMKREMAIAFIFLDMVTIGFGVVTDVILPLTTPFLPALASVGTALFGIVYFAIIYKNDVFNINLVISSNDILQTSNNLIFVMDENREILKYNNAVSTLLGYNKTELLGESFMRLTEREIDFSRLSINDDLMNADGEMRCKDGTVKYMLLSASVAKDKNHNFLCIIISCQDVSKQKKIQCELEEEREKYKKLADDYQRLAYFDPLTGLPNRRHFFDALKGYVEDYNETKNDFAAIFMDLNNFKHANDVYGHEGGDELLKAAADKLRNCVEGSQFVARLGGDEFIIIMPCTSGDCVQSKVCKIKAEFKKTILFNGSMYEIGISAGYGVFSQFGDSVKLMRTADEAMYGDKKGIFESK